MEEHEQLKLGELGLEDLDDLVGALEVVTLDVLEDLEHPRRRGGRAVAQLRIEGRASAKFFWQPPDLS